MNYEFSYVVKANGKGLTYSDSTELFDINPNTGEIKFIPKEEDSGVHLIVVGVTDENGDTATQSFTLDISGFNNPPELDYIGYQSATVGQEFELVVKATDEEDQTLKYTDDSDLFDINADTGEIKFTPFEVGVYDIKVTVIDEKGGLDSATFNLAVIG